MLASLVGVWVRKANRIPGPCKGHLRSASTHSVTASRYTSAASESCPLLDAAGFIPADAHHQPRKKRKNRWDAPRLVRGEADRFPPSSYPRSKVKLHRDKPGGILRIFVSDFLFDALRPSSIACNHVPATGPGCSTTAISVLDSCFCGFSPLRCRDCGTRA